MKKTMTKKSNTTSMAMMMMRVLRLQQTQKINLVEEV